MYRKMSQVSVGILGVGEIGRAVATRCISMGMRTIGIVRRQPSPEARVDGLEYRVGFEHLYVAAEMEHPRLYFGVCFASVDPQRADRITAKK